MHKRLLPMVLGVALLTGCSAVNTKSAIANPGGEPTVLVVENNALLASRLEVVNVQMTSTGYPVKAQAELRNRWVFELDFAYRFQWFDKDGFEVTSWQRPWTRIVLAGGERKYVQAVAPKPEAVSFKIQVSE
ncbi:YcfL family protein [Spongorhabdus nitratireducens]